MPIIGWEWMCYTFRCIANTGQCNARKRPNNIEWQRLSIWRNYINIKTGEQLKVKIKQLKDMDVVEEADGYPT